MSRIKFIVIFTLAAAAGCSQATADRNGFVIADSKTYEASIYRQNCALCHGAEANGKEVGGKLIPSLRFGEAARKSKDEIYGQIKHGKLPMPAFDRQLTEDEINRMVRFVRSDLQGKADE